MQLLVALTLAALLGGPVARADEHVLSLSDLHRDLSQSAAARQANSDAIDHFLASPRVQKTLKAVGTDSDQLRRAASLLDDREKEELAARARAAEADVVGGELSDAQTTLIILAVVGFAFLSVLVLAFK
jgi:hypothetical protein